MPLNIEIADDDLNGFNPQACDKLQKAIQEFASELIEEANRIESASSTTSGPPEITSSMVNDAQLLIRRGLQQPKKRLHSKILQVISTCLATSIGILYDSVELQDGRYMFFFIIIITITLLTTTISVIKD